MLSTNKTNTAMNFGHELQHKDEHICVNLKHEDDTSAIHCYI